MVTRKQVAELAGVSEATVSNVVNQKVRVNSGKRERVMDAIKKLNYIPDQNARNLVMRRSNHIGIAIYETTNPFHTEIAKCIESYAIKKGFIVSLFMLDNNMEHKLEAITRRRFDGIVNFMTNEYPSAFIDALQASRTVLINFQPQYGSTLVNDYAEATREMLRKARELGHSNIAYLSCHDEPGFAADSRGQAFFAETGALEFGQARVFYNDDFGRESDQTGYVLANRIVKDYPEVTAVLCTNDLAAIGAIRAFAENGISVPKDVSVMGCDDIALSRILVPALTTIAVDKRRIGEDIAKQIIAELAGGERVHLTFPAQFIQRESLAPCRERLLEKS